MGFQQALSGLSAASTQLDVIGNNVANSSTIGAKESRAEFADVYANSLTGGGNNAVGIGVKVAAITQQFTQGEITTTSNPLDVAINGNGFFQLTMPNGQPGYTRDGQFKVDADGYIVTSQGANLQGFMADATGQLGKTAADLQLSVGGIAPKETTSANLQLNLDAGSSAVASGTTFSPTDPSTYTSVTSMTVYSAQGQEHPMSLYFQKTGDNAWNVYATVDGDATTTASPSGISFDATGKIQNAPVSVTVTPPSSTGLNPVAIDLSSLTQYASSFAVTSMSQDGYAPGDLAGFSIGADGKVQARYSNGQTLTQGQIILANFRNPQGLSPLGGSCWGATASSGDPVTDQVPGTGNVGVLQSGALEQSNVDLTAELVNMITAQRFYQANAQTIKAEDQVMQTIVNLR